MKSWIQDNDIKMYSAHNEGKFVKEKFYWYIEERNL